MDLAEGATRIGIENGYGIYRVVLAELKCSQCHADATVLIDEPGYNDATWYPYCSYHEQYRIARLTKITDPRPGIEDVICPQCQLLREEDEIVYYSCRRFQPDGPPCVLSIPKSDPTKYVLLPRKE